MELALKTSQLRRLEKARHDLLGEHRPVVDGEGPAVRSPRHGRGDTGVSGLRLVEHLIKLGGEELLGRAGGLGRPPIAATARGGGDGHDERGGAGVHRVCCFLCKHRADE